MSIHKLKKGYHQGFRLPGVKPTGRVEIDRGNVLGQDISEFTTLSDGYRLSVSGKNLSPNGSPVPYADGVNLSATSTALGLASYSPVTSYPFTIFADVIPNGGAEMAVTYANPGLAAHSVGIWGDGAGNIRGVVFNSSFNSTTNVAVSATKRIRVAFSAPSSDKSTWQLWVDGARADTGVTGSIAFPSSVNNISIGSLERSGRLYYGGTYFSAGLFNKTLTDPELRLLTSDPYQLLKPANQQYYFTAEGGASTSLTTTTITTEADLATGGGTITQTLTGDTFIAAGASFDAQRQAFIDGLVSAQGETNGWNAKRSLIQVTDVARTSDTVVTITLPALTGYDITAAETITHTIPASILTGGVAIVASPTIEVAASVPVSITLTPINSTNLFGISGVLVESVIELAPVDSTNLFDVTAVTHPEVISLTPIDSINTFDISAVLGQKVIQLSPIDSTNDLPPPSVITPVFITLGPIVSVNFFNIARILGGDGPVGGVHNRNLFILNDMFDWYVN